MEIQDSYIPEEDFKTILREVPQVCVEIVLETENGVLLAKRETPPRVWFWPGSRLYKGEKLERAACRVAREELGIEVTLEQQLGVHSHFWEPEETEEGTSRHTVNIVYLVSPEISNYEITLDEQHSDYRFLSEVEPELHPYIQEYIEEHNLV